MQSVIKAHELLWKHAIIRSAAKLLIALLKYLNACLLSL